MTGEIYHILTGKFRNSYLCTMMERTENSKNYFGTLVLMVLLFLLANSLPERSGRTGSASTHSPASIEICRVPVKAVSTDVVELPSAQNSCLTLVSRPVYNLFCNTLKVVIDNNHISHKLAFLSKEAQQLRPILLERWSPSRLSRSDHEAPAVLS
jgi:hypothetical protein